MTEKKPHIKDEILEAFCCDSREQIKRPFVDSGFVYATNGKVIIKTKKQNNKYKPSKKAPINIINSFPWGKTKGKLIELPKIKVQKEEYEDCEECRGHGRILFYNDYNDYEWECKTCEGVCQILKQRKVKLDNTYLKYELMILISSLPNVKYYPELTERGMMHFFFKGGEGFIMPLRVAIQI